MLSPHATPSRRISRGTAVTGLLQRTVGRIRGERPITPLPYRPPAVIFGTGGSGTRVLQVLTDRSGFFMGTNLNGPGDSLDIGWFMRRWLDKYLGKSDWIGEMSRGSQGNRFRVPSGMPEDFAATIEDHREAIDDPDARWGWKTPRAILIFPFVHEFFPGMKAVHLVRDGRDMAYSKNQNQARRHGPQLLDKKQQELPKPVRSMTFWARVNLAAARYGERNLGDHYLRMRYEDVCADPRASSVRLLDFLQSPAPRESMQEFAASEIRPSSTMGRWRDRDPDQIAEIESVGAEALRKFGYE
jgi:hypothetical protein